MSDVFEATIEPVATLAGSLAILSLRAEWERPPELAGTIESGDVTVLEWDSLEW